MKFLKRQNCSDKNQVCVFHWPEKEIVHKGAEFCGDENEMFYTMTTVVVTGRYTFSELIKLQIKMGH